MVAYTGGAVDEDVVSYAQMVADEFVKKDVDINEWRDTLDEVIESLSDPVLVWKRQRDALVQADVSTLAILRVEDAFVRSIQLKNSQTYVSYVAGPGINKNVRAIGQSLIASGIFRLLFG